MPLAELILIPLMLFSLAFARDRQLAREDELVRECCIDRALEPTVGWTVIQSIPPGEAQLFCREDASKDLVRAAAIAPEPAPFVVPPARERFERVHPHVRRR